MRRFITLIDALYEHKVLVVVLADAPVMELFSPDGVFSSPSAADPGIQGENSATEEARDGSVADPSSDSDQASRAAEARLQFDEVS